MHDEPTAIRDWQINAHLALVILCETLDARPDNAELDPDLLDALHKRLDDFASR